jgi:RimJ/RimL family protein N-acetyltransferase
MTSDAPHRPVGPVIDTTPSARPGAIVLEGRFCRIEKLDPAKHADDLWTAVRGHDDIWDYLGYGPFPDAPAFRQWLDERAVLLDPSYYAVLDKATGRAIGAVTLMEIRPAMRVIEIGHIFYSPALQRTPIATEAQYLIARYVFEELGYRRYEWKCNALNQPSRRAAERLGFTYEGTFRQHMIVKGRNRDTAWFAMLDSDWPGRKLAFERWLDPANFDAAGRQHEALSALNPPQTTAP